MNDNKKMIPVTQMNRHLVTLLQGGVSKGLNETRLRLIGEVLRTEYKDVRPINVEVVCFDSGRREECKYIKDSMYNLHSLRGTVVGIKI